MGGLFSMAGGDSNIILPMQMVQQLQENTSSMVVELFVSRR
jgi:hypothetical protein